MNFKEEFDAWQNERVGRRALVIAHQKSAGMDPLELFAAGFARRNYSCFDAAQYERDKDARIARLESELAEARKVPDGWKLVPIVPTDRMIGAGIEAYDGKCEDSYAAMLAAAPQPPAVAREDV